MQHKSVLWRRLWEYDPNGLLVLDETMSIALVNRALCRMLKAGAEALVGRPAVEILGDIQDFQKAYAEQAEIHGQEQASPAFDLYVRKEIFPVPVERVAARIFVDLTVEWKQHQELRRRTLQEVRQVVDKQMRVAQEIAGLLGETTAETKVSLLRLLEMLRRDDG